MQIKKFSSGQSLIEAIFAIMVVMVLVGGVVKLVSQSISAKTKTFDRKVATNVAITEIERLITVKKENPEMFWEKSYWNQYGSFTDSQQEGYRIRVSPNLNGNPLTSVSVDITVSWQDGGQELVISRYFSK